MRVRLILENGGHALSKRLDMPEAPAVGSIVLADRERRVADVELAADGVADVYLKEDADDLAVQLSPVAHLARLDAMLAAGWDVEREEELRAWLMRRIERQGRPGPVTQH